METKRSRRAASLLLWTAVAAMFSQNLVIPVMSETNFEDQKTTILLTRMQEHLQQGGGSYGGTPPSHGGGGYGGTPPSHGGGGTGGTPPSHGGGGYGGTPPSHGGGSYGGTPPANCGTPQVEDTTILLHPLLPEVAVAITHLQPQPLLPPPLQHQSFYWRNHPTLIWGLFGFWGTSVGSAFGVTSLPGFGSNMNILQALSNTRSDGLGELYREGTAALLNSIAHTRFPYTTSQVRDSFVAALGSNKAAAAQARLFKMANEGRIKPRA
ncbi:hypothetical protein DH2020_011752 [Rehmannia glutinosa]|uniref:Protodermal factor 1 n=1 Tax=Rehmannia glutinosa TaxID=99300 RepID=A0ABR0XEA3_REHGL